MRESVFSLLLFRKGCQISLINWLKLILLECYLGEQLIEMLAITASFRKPSTFDDIAFVTPVNGWSVDLIEYIPSTFINKLLHKQIIQLLRIKFVNHYKVLVKEEESTLYTHNPKNLFLLTELKLAYNTIWVTLNLSLDIIVYVVTKDLTLAILSGALLEFIRRFKW
jgi:hypothetical protein